MKSAVAGRGTPGAVVAPHWGAWIEIRPERGRRLPSPVAPHWGAWIEIDKEHTLASLGQSHPTGVRGLKLTL